MQGTVGLLANLHSSPTAYSLLLGCLIVSAHPVAPLGFLGLEEAPHRLDLLG
jgi:hypothetical protein